MYVIRAVVESVGGDGGKKTAESYLTVNEPVSDAHRIAENNSDFIDDANDFEELYDLGPDLDDWKDFRNRTSGPGKVAGNVTGEPGPINWMLIIIVAALISVIIFYIYKKTSVVDETEQAFRY
jgi:hypothetical protein